MWACPSCGCVHRPDDLVRVLHGRGFEWRQCRHAFTIDATKAQLTHKSGFEKDRTAMAFPQFPTC
jgi:hypothetical protein